MTMYQTVTTNQLNSALANAPVPRRFEAALGRLEAITNAHAANADRAESLADRFGGPNPQEAKTGASTPAPGNVAATLERYIEFLDGIANRTHEALNRLESL
jgi:hypothetical protein